jgi:acyl carrier protein
MRAVAESRTALGFDIDPRRYINETLEQLSIAHADEPASGNDAAFADRIVSIWAKLLGLAEDDIQPQDNFFDLGGTSILAMQAVSAMEREIDWKIEPRRIISETILQLALRPSSHHSDNTVDRAPADRTPVADASGGMLSRLFGKIGRG